MLRLPRSYTWSLKCCKDYLDLHPRWHTPPRTPVPRVVDTPVAKLDRQKSESYWRERFAASVGPPSSLHRGTSGKPCRAYNRSPNGCPRGNACPDSHAVDANSLRLDGCDGNTCLHHRPPQKGTSVNASQAKDMDECAYGHPAVMDPETEAAFKEIEALLFQESGKKGLSPLRFATSVSRGRRGVVFVLEPRFY